MPDGTSKAGGHCNYCFTGIRYEYVIKSSDDKQFVVGCDCVAKTGAVVTGFRETRLKFARDRRAAKNSVTREQRQKEYNERINARREEWTENNKSLATFLMMYSGENNFIKNMVSTMIAYGGLSVNQTLALQKACDRIDEQEKIRVQSKHQGSVGVRYSKKRLKVTASIHMGHTEYYGRAIARYLVKMEDEKQNQFVWWTSAGQQLTETFCEAAYTVKAHTDYNGMEQTTVTRVTIK